MNRMLLAALLTALVASAGVSAQEAQPAQDQGAEENAPGNKETAEEALPEIDVWDETQETRDDVFIPSESISADSSIAFPSDI